MKRLLLILVVASGSILIGYLVMQVIQHYKTEQAPVEAPRLDTEVKEMIQFMNPAITEEIAQKYLEELEKLNVRYGYVAGGSPKGDIETMRSYGAEVDELQKKYSILPAEQTVPTNGQTSGQATPALAPKTTDVTYKPPSGPSEVGVATASPKLQQQQTAAASGPPAASPFGAPSSGGTSTPPQLIIQDNIPPPPPLPPMMQSE